MSEKKRCRNGQEEMGEKNYNKKKIGEKTCLPCRLLVMVGVAGELAEELELLLEEKRLFEIFEEKISIFVQNNQYLSKFTGLILL